MLSKDLESLRNHLHGFRDTGVALRGARVGNIVAILDVAIADAEALEACYAMVAGEAATAAGQAALPLDDIPGTVAVLEDYRARRACERFLVPVRPGGGAA